MIVTMVSKFILFDTLLFFFSSENFPLCFSDPLKNAQEEIHKDYNESRLKPDTKVHPAKASSGKQFTEIRTRPESETWSDTENRVPATRNNRFYFTENKQ